MVNASILQDNNSVLLSMIELKNNFHVYLYISSSISPYLSFRQHDFTMDRIYMG